MCGALSIAALLLQKKHKRQRSFDAAVEDFSLNQQAMLQRVREIWDEHCGAMELAGPFNHRTAS